jgi:predicted nucleic acid-binding protein
LILVDTGVWIDYFNGIINVHTEKLDVALMEGNVVMADIILLEILQGFRTEKDYETAKAMLSALDQYSIFNAAMVERCAENYRALRRKGITVRKTIDVIIASYCITHHLPLLFNDRDFLPFVSQLGLMRA